MRPHNLHRTKFRRCVAVGSIVVSGLLYGFIVERTSAEVPTDRGFEADTHAPAPGTSISVHRSVVVDGESWQVQAYRTVKGLACFFLVVPREGKGGSCVDPAALSSRTFIAHAGSRQEAGNLTSWDSAWVWGVAQTPIASVKVVMTDCSTRSVAMDAGGVFLYVIPHQTLHSGVWPHRVEGRSSSNAIVASQSARLLLPPGMTARARPTALAACR
jgi:hypothetical protein